MSNGDIFIPLVDSTTTAQQGVNMSNPLLGFFNEVKSFVTHFLPDASKIIADAPRTIHATKEFWTASIPVAAALALAIDERGVNIPADTAAFAVIKAWLPAAKAYAAVIEADAKDFAPAQTVPPQPVQTSPVAIPVVEAPAVVVASK